MSTTKSKKAKPAAVAAPSKKESLNETELKPVEGAENMEDADLDEMEAGTGSGGISSADAALAMATSAAESSGSLKNFRHHPDIENFYRFIFENDLRVEAYQILSELHEQKKTRKLLKTQKAQAH